MLKKIIYDYISSLELSGLGIYSGSPAIFEQQAPEDTDSGWEGVQYGRVIYDLLIQDDTARKVSGSLRVMVAYTDIDMLPAAERKLQDAFDTTFFTDVEEDLTIATTWQKSEPFNVKSGGGTDIDVFGTILYFDVYAFPVKRYFPMDAVASLADYIKSRYPDVWVINAGAVGSNSPVWQPGRTAPDSAVYVRLDQITPGSFPSTYACTWYTVRLWVHVVSASYDVANKILTSIYYALSEVERFPMDDGSPFFVAQMQISQGNSTLRDGQMQVQGQYGILREIAEEETMNTININERRK